MPSAASLLWNFLRDPANWWRTVQIDLGSRDGVRTNLTVLTPDGLVGKIDGILGQGRIDLILATMGDTADRRKVVGMIEPNYYAGGTNVLAAKKAGLAVAALLGLGALVLVRVLVWLAYRRRLAGSAARGAP